MKVRLTGLCALALATASAVAMPALAGTAAGSVQPSGGFGTPSEIPWGSVGSGWLLAQWGSGASNPHPAHSYLVIANQAGQRYVVLKETGALAGSQLLAWSGDGQRALFDTQTTSGKVTLLVVDLRTGAIADRFMIPTSSNVSFQTAGFTRPNGLGIVADSYVGNHNQLTRYSLSGQVQGTYPDAFPSVGQFDASWLYSPDGTELVLGAQHGIALVTNGGTIVGESHLAGASSCEPQRWWASTVVLASCFVGHGERLYEFHVGGGAPTALTRSNVPPDDGDLSAWRVSSHVYVEVASACGYVYLARLEGAAPIMVHVPGVPSGHSVYVEGATSSALLLSTSLACQGHPSLLWYTPSSNAVKVVLGPPVTGGEFYDVVAYPPPLG